MASFGSSFIDLLNIVRDGDVDAVRTLIDSHSLKWTDAEGIELLCCAVKTNKLETAELLLPLDCRVNREIPNIDSPLHHAVRRGNVDFIRILLDKGADIDALNENGRTPLLIALQMGYKSVVKLLLSRGASVDISDNENLSPIYYAVQESTELESDLLKFGAAIDKKGYLGFTPLHYAAKAGQLEVIRLLLSKGAPIDTLNNENETALFLAHDRLQRCLALKMSWPNRHQLILSSYEIIILLLSHGARIEEKDKNGDTLLFKAVLMNNSLLVEIYLDFDVDVYRKNKSGLYAIELAAKLNKANAFKALVLNFGDINVSNKIVNYHNIWKSILAGPGWDNQAYLCLRVLQEHIAKLKNANFFLKECYSSLLLNAIDYDYEEACKYSLAQMKSLKIGNSLLTFHEILVSTTNQLVALMRSDNFPSDVGNHPWWHQQPRIYQHMTCWNFNKALRRKRLLEEFEPLFCDIFQSLPKLCVDRITDYLTNDDLRILICPAKIQWQDKVLYVYAGLNFVKLSAA